MATEIHWDCNIDGVRGFEYTGRNGVGKCCGLSLTKVSDRTWVRPINSKGTVGRCHIDIPADRTGLVAASLLPMKEIFDRIGDRVPLLTGLDDGLDRVIESYMRGEL